MALFIAPIIGLSPRSNLPYIMPYGQSAAAGQSLQVSVVIQAGGWTAQLSGTLAAVLNDGSDASYAQLLEADTGGEMILRFTRALPPASGTGTLTIREESA